MIKRQPHTLILDQGRIVQASPTQLVLRHPDGTPATIQLSASTVVTPRTFQLRRGWWAVAMAVDGGPAVRVKATPRP
ncbi:MAG TPA: hypothetical protein VI408_08680 [Gaiellaceae bacterium]